MDGWRGQVAERLGRRPGQVIARQGCQQMAACQSCEAADVSAHLHGFSIVACYAGVSVQVLKAFLTARQAYIMQCLSAATSASADTDLDSLAVILADVATLASACSACPAYTLPALAMPLCSLVRCATDPHLQSANVFAMRFFYSFPTACRCVTHLRSAGSCSCSCLASAPRRCWCRRWRQMMAAALMCCLTLAGRLRHGR